MKKILIALLVISLSMTSAYAAPKHEKELRGKGNPWVCGLIIVPRFWCHKWTP